MDIISSFDILPSESKKIYLLDPVYLCSIIIIICLILYIFGYKTSVQ